MFRQSGVLAAYCNYYQYDVLSVFPDSFLGLLLCHHDGYPLHAGVCPFPCVFLHALHLQSAVPVHTCLNHYTGHAYQSQHYDSRCICSILPLADVFLFHVLHHNLLLQYQNYKHSTFCFHIHYSYCCHFCFLGQALSALLQPTLFLTFRLPLP